MAQWPTDDQILTAVRGAGWLLEHDAIRVLTEAGTSPRAGWAFADPDEPTKSRELDVWAFQRLLHDEDTKVSVTARFLVECKQSSNPYVGVGYDLPCHRLDQPPEEHVLPKGRVTVPIPGEPGRLRILPGWAHFGFHELAQEHRDTSFRVTQLTRLDRANGGAWTATNAGVFTSLVYPLAKALSASKRHASPPVPGASNRVKWTEFALHFPVVLISCPLYVVDATDPEPRIEQRPWVTATRELKSESVTGTFEIDVVTQPAFADYVADRQAFAQAFADKVALDPLYYTGERDHPQE